ncbi:MAG: CBS domain-containing protein [Deltaproteobacteria bacterium]|nr:CBS domain-containing protein [Deltaproteobacteria bacterium]
MRVSEVMSRGARPLRSDEEVSLRSFPLGPDVPLLPVVDINGKLEGAVTRVSLLEALLHGDRPRARLRADEAMVRDTASIQASDRLEDAFEQLANVGATALPVVNSQREVVGTLSDADLLVGLRAERSQQRQLTGVRVGALMTPTPTVVASTATVGDVVALMLQEGVPHLPVVADDDKLLGLISERDVRARIGMELREFDQASPERLEERAISLMTIDPLAVEVDRPIADALDVMFNGRRGAVPVVTADDRVVGIVSYLEVLGWLLGREPAHVELGLNA